MFHSIDCFYVFSFSRVGICLLALHYSSEAVFHAARLIYFLDKAENGSKGTGFIGMKVAVCKLPYFPAYKTHFFSLKNVA
jgi:hypothetical protein